MTGAELTRAIKDRGLDQRKAAAALGVDESTVSRWINGSRPIPDIAVVALQAVPPKGRKGRKPAA